MKLRQAFSAALCAVLVSGSAFAVTTGTNAPAPAPDAADNSTDDTAKDVAIAPEQDDSNPYSAIVKANVFHLNEPPKPQAKEDQTLLNLPKVNISGFKQREGEPVRALFATVPKDPKEPPKYFNLAEGEKEDILEVKKISPDQESVDVIIAGTPVTLTVKSNSFVQPVVIPKAGVPTPGYNPLHANPGLAARPPQPAPSPLGAPRPGYNPQQYDQHPGGYNPGAGVYNAPGNGGGNGGVIVAGGGVSQASAAPVAVPVPTPNPAYGQSPVYGQPANPQESSSVMRSIPTRIPRTQPYSNPNAVPQ